MFLSREMFEEAHLLFAIDLEIPEFPGVPPSVKVGKVEFQ